MCYSLNIGDKHSAKIGIFAEYDRYFGSLKPKRIVATLKPAAVPLNFIAISVTVYAAAYSHEKTSWFSICFSCYPFSGSPIDCNRWTLQYQPQYEEILCLDQKRITMIIGKCKMYCVVCGSGSISNPSIFLHFLLLFTCRYYFIIYCGIQFISIPLSFAQYASRKKQTH